MQIDVIIPTYNRAGQISRALESVLSQSYSEFKIFIVDDGSTDETQKIIGPYLEADSRIHYLKIPNSGVSKARNIGVQKGSSPWIAFLDSDDEWLPSKLEQQVQYVSGKPQAYFLHSNEIWFRNGKRVNAGKKFNKSGSNLFERSLKTCLISPSTVMLKRSLFDSAGGFDESFEVCEDYDLWLRILAQTEVDFIEANLIIKYGGHPDQLSMKYPGMDFWRIKSMVNLLRLPDLRPEKRELISREIEIKAPILLQGYLKHANLVQHRILAALLEDYRSLAISRTM